MRCPYCAEQILDEAVFCRFCKHDLHFIKPMMDELAKLKSELEQVRTSLLTISAAHGPMIGSSRMLQPNTNQVGLAKAAAKAGAGLIAVAAYSVLVALDYVPREPGFLIAGPAILLMTSGFWVGSSWAGPHVGSYTLLAALLGIGGVAVHYLTTMLIAGMSIHFHSSEVGYSLLFMVSSALSFLTGAFFGDLWERGRHPPVPPSYVSRMITETLIGNPDQAGRQKFDEKVKSVSAMMAAAAPFLTLLGTAITAYFGYLGALSKGSH